MMSYLYLEGLELLRIYLSNFAFKGADMEINDDVVQVLQDFYQ